jgi:hypothetical protein
MQVPIADAEDGAVPGVLGDLDGRAASSLAERELPALPVAVIRRGVGYWPYGSPSGSKDTMRPR